MRGWIVGVMLASLVTTVSAQQPPTTNAEIRALEQMAAKQAVARDRAGQLQTQRKLVAAQRKLSGDDSVYTERREDNLAATLTALYEFGESIALQKTLLAKAERRHGASSREVYAHLNRLAFTYFAARMFDESDAIYQRLLAVSKTLHGDTGATYAGDLSGYAVFLSTRGEYIAAQRLEEQALKIQEAAKQDIKGKLITLGSLYIFTDFSRAKAAFDRYLSLIKSDPIETQIQMNWWVSGFYRRAGRFDLATPLEKTARDLARAEIARIEKAKGKDAAELATPLFALGTSLLEVGDLAFPTRSSRPCAAIRAAPRRRSRCSRRPRPTCPAEPVST
jgi:tetratricopeptide (TPR) repeat protein